MRQRIYLRIHCDLDNDDYYNNVTMAPDYDDHYEPDYYDYLADDHVDHCDLDYDAHYEK